MEIKPYTQELEQEVRAFNERLQTAGVEYGSCPLPHEPRLPKATVRHPYQEYFVTVHEGVVHGGYVLTHSRFAIRGEMVFSRLRATAELSEGIVDQRYSMIGVIQLQEALRQQPLMYGLGMAGINGPLSRLFAAMGWTVLSVPLLFRVVSTSKFLVNLNYLRRGLKSRIALEILRRTPVPSASIRLLQARRPQHDRSVLAENCGEFECWTNAIWQSCRDCYSLIAERDCKTLNFLYPASDLRFLRLKVSRGGKGIGWAVMLAPQLSDHQYFGNMRVGSIVDCLAAPNDAYWVVQQSTRFLEELGVDMIVSAQASSAWCEALSQNGYLSGPSNVALALSPCLTDRLKPFEDLKQHIHINRGDGEGPTVL